MITKKQKAVLNFITKYQSRKSYAPSLDEIRRRFRLASISTAHFHLKNLEDSGYVRRERNRPRAIHVYGVNGDASGTVWGAVADAPAAAPYAPASIRSRSPAILPPLVRPDTKLNGELPLNKIICGDAVEVMQAMPSDCVDLVVTSPPYDELRNYNGYAFNFEGVAKGLFRVIKKGGVLVWVVGDKINKGNRSFTSFRQAIFFQSLGFSAHDVMIYRKKNTPFMRSNAYTNCYEFMFVFSKGSPKTFNPLKTKTVRQGQEMLPFNKKADGINKKIRGELKPEKTLTNIWDYAVGFGGSTSDKIAFQHTAVFPERLAEDHILSWTKIGDVVFDPMCGSGTTCKMAGINKRHYIGCDISKEYVELTENRLRYFNL
ncbi:MAG: DNA methyltransferase [Patescibacteria group bacterium]